MKKPEVTLQNYDSVYEYYAQYRQPKIGAYLGHKAMSLVFKPNVEYAKDAEQKINKIVDMEGRLIVAANHLSDNDQYVVSAMALREKTFRPIIGKTFIQSKEVLFNHPNKKIQPLLRRGVDIMGAIPAFRKKDVGEENAELRRQATDRMIQTSVQKLSNGQHMAIFPEGSRNKDNPDVVQDLKPGIATILGQTATQFLTGVIPIGFTYQGDKYRPQMWIEEPMFYYPETKADEFLVDLRDSLQYSVDRALENANQ